MSYWAGFFALFHSWMDRNLGWLVNTWGSNRGNILKKHLPRSLFPSFWISVRCRSLSTALQYMPPSPPTTVFKTHVLTLQVPWEHVHCHLFLSISNLLKPPSLNHMPISGRQNLLNVFWTFAPLTTVTNFNFFLSSWSQQTGRIFMPVAIVGSCA